MNGLNAPTFRIFTGQIKQNLFIGQKCFPPVECIKDKFCVKLAKYIPVDPEHVPENLAQIGQLVEEIYEKEYQLCKPGFRTDHCERGTRRPCKGTRL